MFKRNYPDLAAKYQDIYKGNKWGQATGEYYKSINSLFNRIATKYGVPKRIPPDLYNDLLWENDLVFVILEHLDYLLMLEGKRPTFRYAAHSI